jgi:hypothetical protein
MARQPLGGLGLLIFRGFGITHCRRSTLGRTPLDEGSARRRDLYLTTHNTHKRQTSMPPAGFEPTIPASERPQTQALDCAATGIGVQCKSIHKYKRRHILIRYGPDDLGITVRFPVGIRIFFSKVCRSNLWPTQHLIRCALRGAFPGVKLPGSEANHRRPSSAEDKNAMECTSTPHMPSSHFV